jgi:hypothetical protein
MVKKKNSKSRRQSRDFELIPQKLGSDRLLYKMHVTYITWSKREKILSQSEAPISELGFKIFKKLGRLNYIYN